MCVIVSEIIACLKFSLLSVHKPSLVSSFGQLKTFMSWLEEQAFLLIHHICHEHCQKNSIYLYSRVLFMVAGIIEYFLLHISEI